MFFKNLIAYRIKDGVELTCSLLSDALEGSRAQPCGRLDIERSGFVCPQTYAPDGVLVRAADGHMMICLATESKILPTQVIRDAVQAKVAEIEQRDARRVYKKEREQLKDEALLELLPRAFTRTSYLHAVICPKNQYIIVDTSSHSKAEDLLARLRDVLGALPVLPFTVANDTKDTMTRWVQETADSPFVVGRSCELFNPLDLKSLARFKCMDLDSEEITQHLEAGFQVSQLAINWRDWIACVMSRDLTFKQVKFMDVLVEEAHSLDNDDASAVWDAEFALNAATLVQFLSSVTAAFGGEGIRHSQSRHNKGDAHLQIDAFSQQQ